MFLKAFATALTFLTRIPCPQYFFKSPQDVSALSTQFYPLVGCIVGLCLLLFAWISQAFFSAEVHALLVLVLWVLLSGALHLDGFADSVDALVASHRSPNAIQTVMKDSNIGAMAAVGLVLLLSLKWLCLRDVWNSPAAYVLFVIPILSRYLALLYMRFTPYVGGGIAKNMHVQMYDVSLLLQAVGLGALVVILLGIWPSLVLLASSCLLIVAWRSLWKGLIHGYTGDTVGALIEIHETLLLLLLASLFALN